MLTHLICSVCSIQKGEAIKCMGMFLCVNSNKLKVAYLAAFVHAQSLHSTGLTHRNPKLVSYQLSMCVPSTQDSIMEQGKAALF